VQKIPHQTYDLIRTGQIVVKIHVRFITILHFYLTAIARGY